MDFNENFWRKSVLFALERLTLAMVPLSHYPVAFLLIIQILPVQRQARLMRPLIPSVGLWVPCYLEEYG